MNETENLCQIATSIIEQSTDVAAVEKAAEILKVASEIEKQRAETRKLAVEEKKLSNDIDNLSYIRKSENFKSYISMLAPLFTTVVLAGTLLQQSYQFSLSEHDKQMEAKRQADVAEDLRWAESVKFLSQNEKLSPTGVVLESFIQTRHANEAYRIAVEALRKTEDPQIFANLFGTVFDPISWNNLPQVLEVDRTLHDEWTSLNDKAWDNKKREAALSRLSLADHLRYDILTKNLTFISLKVAPLLKGPRTAGIPLDLHSVSLYGDFEGADFSGAALQGANLAAIRIKGANLTGVTGYEDAFFSELAWWQVRKMDADLFDYLLKNYPYIPTDNWYPQGSNVSKSEYDADLARLRKSVSRP